MTEPIRTSPAPPRPSAASKRMAAYRTRMRAQGLRPVQIWLPDTGAPAFIEKCRRQSLAAAEARDEHALMEWVESVRDWSDR